MKSFSSITRQLRAEGYNPFLSSVITAHKTNKLFFHSGDFGDIIYSLPTVRALGGGTLLLGPSPVWKTRLKLTEELAATIQPLLRAQPYIQAVRFSEKPGEPIDVDLTRFRELLTQSPKSVNLAEAHLLTYNLPVSECQKPWLTVDQPEPYPDRPVLIHRSFRWQNDAFPWKRIMQQHAHQALFIGLPDEYEAFVQTFGYLPFQPTKNFLELARLIAGCRVFIGNQSCPYAIAEGLKVNTVQETCTALPNCHFERPNALYDVEQFLRAPEGMVQPLAPRPPAFASNIFNDRISPLPRLRERPHIKSLWSEEELRSQIKPLWLAQRTGPHETVFYMSGDLGDILYVLPTVRALGGGRLRIGPARSHSYYVLREPMTRFRFDLLAPLLALQKSYLSAVDFCESSAGWQCHVDLNDCRRLFREPYYRPDRNLVDVPALFFGLSLGLWRTRWLEVDHVNRVARYIFARSPRYHNPDFPWKRVVEKHGSEAVFIGPEAEHEAFVAKFGKVRHFPTKNLLEAARVIAGADCFIGNQSSPLAIAEGLKQNCVREHYAGSPNCIFDRQGHTDKPETLLCLS